MGWLWSSSSDEDNTKSKDTSSNGGSTKKLDFSLTDEQRSRIFGQPGAHQSANQTRDAQADKELEDFLNGLPTSETSKRDATAAVSSSEAESPERTNHDRILPDGSLNIAPEAMYPRTMSCRQAFDQAFYCQSLGGKFNDIYRYGHLQSCSEQWGAFWFCMSARTLSQKDRERQIKNYYAQRDERKKKEFGSSENIWEIRDKPVQRAFWKDPDVDPEDDNVQLKE
ncbi:hypothetical protein LTR37_004219 [Vermiconidia calcicola]|uniref:Uncharacterized protein n=1 Tax=Vermiconidia calcicola TaxID=1690605 RepID=A0ACC3NP26_9PEZI|nr:hypothetical protein LTR37_004219 [Vermiconidia calcicola]